MFKTFKSKATRQKQHISTLIYLGFLVSYVNAASISKLTLSTYLIAVWMALNIVLLLMLLPADYVDLNNWIELGLWLASIPALLSMKKWGAALAVSTLIYTLSTSVSIIIYYQVWPNAIRVAINAVVIIFMFRNIFENKFK